ncbi:hypothetical protein [Rhodoferax antarcticus]|uniref:Endonuclease/exonuclease/phosphatase domain-containing protein n=1 Tax=Rhodoferax antarcticus ANT.BR TaxID=1111071 RepID=A0A1Q8YIS6_9BURK|nr:hypothetical protein [Rhodoferax antarcticus]APW47985.1 hypothetical protein RA876_18375 [Rhodoferax antarcticus]OLP07800.1 hypothetical protein BLL52_0896 [Rhodoferax antarcticus ANT.BR]
MKIANWNLKRIGPSERRAEPIRQQLKAVNADIWVLTETHELISPGSDFSSVMSGKTERKAGKPLGVDFKLAALRWPERTLLFDDGHSMVTHGPSPAKVSVE